MAQEPLLSIVITSYTTERLKDIYKLFDSIKAQTYPNIEVIFIVERSKELYEKAKEYGEKIRLSLFKPIFVDKEAGIAEARNIGIDRASGEFIGFVDDDVILSPQWAEVAVRSLREDAVVGVTGPALPLWEDESDSFWFPREFYWIISCTGWFNCNEKKEVRNTWGHGMVFKREAFKYCRFGGMEYSKGAHAEGKVGPVVDDHEFSLNVRLKTQKGLLYNPEMVIWHHVYKFRTLHKFIRRQAFWQGYSKAMLKKRYRNSWKPETEMALLRRIFIRLLPCTLVDMLRNPKIEIKRFYVSALALIYIALGYLSAFNEKLGSLLKRVV